MESNETAAEPELHCFDDTGSTKTAASPQSSLCLEPSSIDELNHLYHEMGWDGAYTQVGSGPFSACYRERIDGSIVATSDSLSVPISTRLSTLPDCYLLGVMVSNSPATLNGHHVDSDSLILVHPDKEFYLSTTGPATSFVTFIPRLEVENQLGDEYELLVKSNRTSHIFHNNSIAETGRFKSWYRNCLWDTDVAEEIDPDSITLQLEETRANVLEQAVTRLQKDSRADKRIDRSYASRRVADVIDYMRHNPQSILTTTEMVERARMSRRTFFTKFTRSTGFTPQHYFRYVRLEAFRRALLRDEGSITELGMTYGFCNLGDLARLYQETFGELPMQTKRKVISIASGSRFQASGLTG